MSDNKVTLPGSDRQPLGIRVGDQPADEMIEVSIILKPKAHPPIPEAGGAAVTREEFAAKYGADESSIEQVKKFAQAHHLTVTEVSAARRTVKVEGTAANMSSAFDAPLARYEHDGCQYRGRTGSLKVSSALGPHVEAVLGLDNRPQARAHFRVRSEATPNATAVSYTPRQVAQLYQFPLTETGAGQSIAILELGGGYKPADLAKYFAAQSIKEPTIIAVLVDKAKNSPTNANSADGEVLLDIEVAGSVAPGAKIVVYFAPNTTQGFQDALTTAIHDTTNKPSVISISWGGAESTWTAQAMNAFDSAAQGAAALGVTICAASGDNGSGDGVSTGVHVDFPASSPHILACGGTSLQGSGTTILTETVWNDGASGGATGGGYSKQFALPAWQASAGIKPPTGLGRGVPDVSGDADPQTGYKVLVDGSNLVFGGTSAVAPLWSGLIALINQKRGKPLGFLQPTLYALKSTTAAFHDITSGNNGAYSASPGWDATTGLGSPAGTNLTNALTAAGSTTTKKAGK